MLSSKKCRLHPGTFATLLALALAALSIVGNAAQPDAPQLTATPYNSTGIYDLGQLAGWNVTLPEGTEPPAGKYSYSIKKNNLDVIKTGELDLSSGKAKIEATVDEPAMLYVEIAPPADGDNKPEKIALGAAIAPTKLEPSVPPPADFDAFWEPKIKLLKEKPENAVLTSKDSGKPNVEYATIQMDNLEGQIHGQLAKPKNDGKFPALVIFQWASPPYPLEKSWVTDRAAQGWLALNVEPHDVLPDQPKEYYDALPEKIKHYESIGNDDRDKSYFVRMYLGDYRALDYITSRPDWDGKTLVVMGTSMGGQQSLCMAGLHPKITHLIVNEPAGCDTNGSLHGRLAGYPNFPSNNAKVMETALYVDPVNFAPKIKATCLVAMGFIDTVAPPVGIWIAFNQINGPKQAAPMVDSPHNHQATPAEQLPYTQTSEQWLRTLVKGGDVIPSTAENVQAALSKEAPAIRPAPRTDENSKIAHQQLLEKAKSGQIDVYFAGDSITRRWGSTDPQYKAMLANWKQNFFGWNAANFGWGADRVENILWRLHNGELEGVNPKVIVVHGGTNNLDPPSDGAVQQVVSGIKAIIDVCRKKAPDAVIILTAVFPRNDKPGIIPYVNRVNEQIAQLADGKKIRYLNVNDKLADGDGKLFPGMAGDKLHLTVKGYQVWADGLKPILTEILGPPAAEDHAPPPTGDPSLNKPK